MHRLNRIGVAYALVAACALSSACGGKGKPAETSSDKTNTDKKGTGSDPASKTASADNDKDGSENKKDKGDEKKDKKDECIGFDVSNLEDLLVKSTCEENGVNPESMAPVDLKGKLDVTVAASPSRPAPGGKVDLVVSFANKTKDPLTLHFRINPVPRFEVEVYNLKGKRADAPAGPPPSPPKGVSAPPASEAKTARFTLAANGTARVRVPWEAVKTKWAPEKVRGSSPEKGFPRSPAGPLPKGKYSVKVKTPLVGVVEGEKTVSAPAVELEIAK